MTNHPACKCLPYCEEIIGIEQAMHHVIHAFCNQGDAVFRKMQSFQ
jgi:hypothetical protein